MTSATAVTLAALVLFASACGSDAAPDDHMADEHEHMHENGFAFGEPGDPATADRIIVVTTTDTLRFEPADLTVARGETVTFRVTNAGIALHDFTLGDAATQEEHAAMMATMGADAAHMAGEPNTVLIAVGETRELTWTFTEPGEVLIGCHQPGHYEAGMKATVTVTP